MNVRGLEDAGSLHLLLHCLHLIAEHMQATSHHHMHMSSTRSPSSTVTLSTLEIVEEEYTLVDTLYLDSGTKECNLRVPGMHGA